MKRFGDHIKSKIEEGDIEYLPSSWEQMDKKLSASAPPYQTDFEQKIQEIFSESSIGMPFGSWSQFTENTNLLDDFENSLSDQLKNGEYNSNNSNWDSFSEKYNNSKLTPYEKTIKNVLNSKNQSINSLHWRAFEKTLSKNRAKKIFWRSASIILLAISTGIGISQFTQKKSDTVSKSNELNSTKLLTIGNFDVITNTIQKANIISNKISLENLGENSREIVINQSLTQFKELDERNVLDSENYITVKKIYNKKRTVHTSIIVEVKKPFFSNIEQINPQKSNEVNPEVIKKNNQGAILWLKFWDNPALTGFYGKNTISGFLVNEWEFIDKNKNNKGEFNFVQPIVRIAAYEKRLNSNWSIGGFLNYELKKNWNIKKYATSLSYTKQIFRTYSFRFGVGGTFVSQNLAVNKLTLREKAINSNNIYTTQLGSLKSKEEYSSSYHIGGFLNHKKFFLGYTAFNLGSNNFTNQNNIILTKHRFVGGIHTPAYKNIRASGLLKYEKELFSSFSPAIGISYMNKLFAMYEYEDLSSKKISLGYKLKNNINAQFNYNINSLDDHQNTDLNIDNFMERRGYLSGGLNFIF